MAAASQEQHSEWQYSNLVQLLQKEHMKLREEQNSALHDHHVSLQSQLGKHLEMLEYVVNKMKDLKDIGAAAASPIISGSGSEPPQQRSSPPERLEHRAATEPDRGAHRASSKQLAIFPNARVSKSEHRLSTKGGNDVHMNTQINRSSIHSVRSNVSRTSSKRHSATSGRFAHLIPSYLMPEPSYSVMEPMMVFGSNASEQSSAWSEMSGDDESEINGFPSLKSKDKPHNSDSFTMNERVRSSWLKHVRDEFSDQAAVRNKKRSTKISKVTTLDKTQKCMIQVMGSQIFATACALLILLNVAFLGYETDTAMKNILAKEDDVMESDWNGNVHRVFDCIFVLELAMRIYCARTMFFCGPEHKSNIFDMVLVTISVVEQVLRDFGMKSLRILRALRMTKVLRLARLMRFFSDLRLMVASIVQSCSSLTWALLLLGAIMYLFALIFMQGIIIHLRDNNAAGIEDPEFRAVVVKWYGYLFRTVLTLLEVITGGINWDEAARPLQTISSLYLWAFSFYVTFVVIGVLNVLTGIFVERANELSLLDRDLIVQLELKRNNAFLREMTNIFEEADMDGSGTISWDEFKEYMKNKEIRAYLAAQQLDAYDARQLFNILDVDDDKEISLSEFIMGLFRLRGMAKSIDMVALLKETRSLNSRMRGFMVETDHTLSQLKKAMTTVSLEGADRISRAPSSRDDDKATHSSRAADEAVSRASKNVKKSARESVKPGQTERLNIPGALGSERPPHSDEDTANEVTSNEVTSTAQWQDEEMLA